MKIYLKAYNLILCLSWSALLIWYVYNGFELDKTGMLLLNFSQVAAILEIFHALFKWVSSPIVTTVVQVFSRLFILVLVNLLLPGEYFEVFGISGLPLIIFAWCITEIIRYGYYFTTLNNNESKALLQLRYTTFIVLYPMGVTGELLIAFSWMNKDGLHWDLTDIVFAGIFILYLIFFPKLYMHMWSQRRKKLA